MKVAWRYIAVAAFPLVSAAIVGLLHKSEYFYLFAGLSSVCILLTMERERGDQKRDYQAMKYDLKIAGQLWRDSYDALSLRQDTILKENDKMLQGLWPEMTKLSERVAELERKGPVPDAMGKVVAQLNAVTTQVEQLQVQLGKVTLAAVTGRGV